MQLKVWDYKREYEMERADILEAVETVFSSGKLILGPAVSQFEAAFSSYCNVKHGIGVDNATNGLMLAMRALGIGPGDEVITVSNTAIPTAMAIVLAGATPRFVDVSEDSCLMDVTQIENLITPHTKAILPVHLFGQCVDMDPLLEIARRRSLFVIEDCAQCHGATYKGRKAGSMSNAAVFSFYPTKPLGGYGDGGMIITDDDELAAKLKRIRQYGMVNVYYSEEIGHNSRLDELHAAILHRKLPRLEGYIEKRRSLAERYNKELSSTSLVLPIEVSHNRHVYYIYVCRHPQRERILKELERRDIFLNVSYPWPIHLMRGFAHLGYKEGDLPVAERLANEVFSIPMYPTLSFEELEYFCRSIREVLADMPVN
jgi:aminotransferase EvaB